MPPSMWAVLARPALLAAATAIAEGRESAQAAFMAGSLHVGGDISAIIANSDRLVGLNDTLVPLRAETTY